MNWKINRPSQVTALVLAVMDQKMHETNPYETPQAVDAPRVAARHHRTDLVFIGVCLMLVVLAAVACLLIEGETRSYSGGVTVTNVYLLAVYVATAASVLGVAGSIFRLQSLLRRNPRPLHIIPVFVVLGVLCLIPGVLSAKYFALG